MSNMQNILSTIDGLAKDDDNVVFLHDSFDLELSENFVIETGVVGFTEDGIVLEADAETIEFLELHDIILEDETSEGRRYRYSEAKTKTVGGNTVMSDGSPLRFADWRSESESETGHSDKRSKEDLEDAYKAYVRRCKSTNESDTELAEMRKLANLKENPNPGDFNQAVASPMGSINYNDTEKVAQANVTGKDPEVEVHEDSGCACGCGPKDKCTCDASCSKCDCGKEKIDEAEYQGRKVTLNKPMQGDVKKSKVYVKNAKGNVVKVNFGHGGSSAKGKTMSIKKNNPERRKAFRARHNCKSPGPKWKARYWSCRAW